MSVSHWRWLRRCAAIAATLCASGSFAQYIPGGSAGMSPAERALLWQFGTRRFNDNYFQRQLFAIESLSRNERMRNQQMLRQQYNAQTRALAEQRRIRDTLSPGRGRFGLDATRIPRGPARQETPDLDADVKSDVLFVWDELGAGFDDADPRFVQSVAPRYSAGMTVLAIRVDGPAEFAGWKKDDILIGLDGFQTKNYSDIAYVLEQPNRRPDEPMAALLIRQGKVFRSQISVEKPKPGVGAAAADGPAGKAVPPSAPAPKPEVQKTEPPTLNEPKLPRAPQAPKSEAPIKPPALPAPKVPAGEEKSASKVEPPPIAAPKKSETAPAADLARPSAEKVAIAPSGRKIAPPPRVDASVPDVNKVPSTTPAAGQAISDPAMTDEELLIWQRLGIRCQSVVGGLADKRFGAGMKITGIRDGSPAQKAKWIVNDVLVGLGEYQIGSMDDLIYVVDEPQRQGARNVAFRVLRGIDTMLGSVDIQPVP